LNKYQNCAATFSRNFLFETKDERRERKRDSLSLLDVGHSHVSDAGKDEEQPDVNDKHLKQLKEQFAANIPTKIQSAIDDN
jgi:hypothetical protein